MRFVTMSKRRLLISLILLPLTLITTLSHASSYYYQQIDQQRILSNARGLEPQALAYAIKGYTWAMEHHQVGNPNVLTVIDFNMPSDAKRLWLIDLRTGRVLMNLFTTQGKNSGDYYARSFSNSPRTEETSLGVYKTLSAYIGKHGLSERLQGLEYGINSNALSRAVVVHPAWYASPNFVAVYHRTGCSWGCFGISPEQSGRFIQLTKGGSIIFAYANQERRDRNLEQV